MTETATAEQTYPLALAYGWDTVADLFAAGFMGVNSAQYLRAAGVDKVTLVDTDAQRLKQMRVEPGWTRVCEDAFTWAKAQPPMSYDAVVLDPWTGELMAKVIEKLPVFLRLAKRHVVVGATADVKLPKRAGWKLVDVVHRHENFGGIYWLVLERT